MTTLREAAQQALEALEGGADSWERVGPAIDALKEALVEDAMQKFTDVNQELEAALGCEHCNQPLYAAVKCRVCGRVTSAEPVQESAICDECGKSKHDGWALYCVKCVEPMFATPQRKPLTEEEISSLWDGHVVPVFGKNGINPIVFARAIERAHGIVP